MEKECLQGGLPWPDRRMTVEDLASLARVHAARASSGYMYLSGWAHFEEKANKLGEDPQNKASTALVNRKWIKEANRFIFIFGI